jgi:hypothetical protein
MLYFAQTATYLIDKEFLLLALRQIMQIMQFTPARECVLSQTLYTAGAEAGKEVAGAVPS